MGRGGFSFLERSFSKKGLGAEGEKEQTHATTRGLAGQRSLFREQPSENFPKQIQEQRK